MAVKGNQTPSAIRHHNAPQHRQAARWALQCRALRRATLMHLNPAGLRAARIVLNPPYLVAS